MFRQPKSSPITWTAIQTFLVFSCLFAVWHALTDPRAYAILYPALWDGVGCGLLFGVVRYCRRVYRAVDPVAAATSPLAWKGVRTDFQLAMASMFLLGSLFTVLHFASGVNVTAGLHELVHKVTDGACCGVLIGALRIARWVHVIGLIPAVIGARTWQWFALDVKVAVATGFVLSALKFMLSLAA